MKKNLLYLVAFVSLSQVANAQSITFTSPALTAATIGSTIQVDYQYTVASAGNIYCAINLQNSDWSWAGTVVDGSLSPAPAGTNVTGSFTFTIPAGTAPSSSLANGKNYKILIELKNSSWSTWLAGAYPAAEINMTAAPLSADSFAQQLNTLSVYPNPVSEVLNIQNSGNLEIANVRITNLLGVIVYANDTQKGRPIDVSQLASGCYVLSVGVGNEAKNMKFIKK